MDIGLLIWLWINKIGQQFDELHMMYKYGEPENLSDTEFGNDYQRSMNEVSFALNH